MIDAVEQTPYQREEARTPGSLARNMLALLIREERRSWRELQVRLRADPDRTEEFTRMAHVRWLQARNDAEIVRRVLHGWEQ